MRSRMRSHSYVIQPSSSQHVRRKYVAIGFQCHCTLQSLGARDDSGASMRPFFHIQMSRRLWIRTFATSRFRVRI